MLDASRTVRWLLYITQHGNSYTHSQTQAHAHTYTLTHARTRTRTHTHTHTHKYSHLNGVEHTYRNHNFV